MDFGQIFFNMREIINIETMEHFIRFVTSSSLVTAHLPELYQKFEIKNGRLGRYFREAQKTPTVRHPDVPDRENAENARRY